MSTKKDEETRKLQEWQLGDIRKLFHHAYGLIPVNPSFWFTSDTNKQFEELMMNSEHTNFQESSGDILPSPPMTGSK